MKKIANCFSKNQHREQKDIFPQIFPIFCQEQDEICPKAIMNIIHLLASTALFFFFWEKKLGFSLLQIAVHNGHQYFFSD
jgi:hypothetical protein